MIMTLREAAIRFGLSVNYMLELAEKYKAISYSNDGRNIFVDISKIKEV